jgi:hypothetical protein
MYRLDESNAARVPTTELPLAECRRTDDVDGVRIYSANLRTIAGK